MNVNPLNRVSPDSLLIADPWQELEWLTFDPFVCCVSFDKAMEKAGTLVAQHDALTKVQGFRLPRADELNRFFTSINDARHLDLRAMLSHPIRETRHYWTRTGYHHHEDPLAYIQLEVTIEAVAAMCRRGLRIVEQFARPDAAAYVLYCRDTISDEERHRIEGEQANLRG